MKSKKLSALLFAIVLLLTSMMSMQPLVAAEGASSEAKIVPLTNQLSEIKSGDYVMEHDHGRIMWSINHHGFSKFSAMFPTIYATLKFDAKDPTQSKLQATVDMTNVVTGITPFNKRLASENYLNSEKFPTSTFTSTSIEMLGKREMQVTGDLSFLGVTKPATMNVVFRQAGNTGHPRGGYRIGFDGTMEINRTKWGMPSSTLGDKVSMELEAEFLAPGSHGTEDFKP